MKTVFNSEISFNDLISIFYTFLERKKRIKKNNLEKLILENHNSFNIDFSISGRVSLLRILRSLNLKENFNVAIQAFNCPVVAKSILDANGNPIYIDIEDKTFSMDLNSLKEEINNVDAVILQYTFGITPTYIKSILQLCIRYKKYLILDKAHCMPENINSELKEIENSCDAIFYSTDHTKAINAIRGGIGLCKVKIKSSFNSGRKINIFLPFLLESIIYNQRSYLVARIAFFFIRIFKLQYMPSDDSDINFMERQNPSNFWFHVVGWQIINKNKRRSDIILFKNRIIGLLYKYKTKISQLPDEVEFTTPLRLPILFDNRYQKINFLNFLNKEGLKVSDWFGDALSCKEDNFYIYKYKKGTCLKAENLSKRVLGFPCTKRFRSQNVINKFSKALKQCL